MPFIMEKEIIIKYRECRLADLDESERRVLDAAIEATDTAYAPYSNFHVGAALLMDDGKIVKGSNQENVAYPSGLCAERTALFSAGVSHSGMAVRTLAIVARNPEGKLVAALPCGACRQVMAEQQSRQGSPMRVICYCSDEKLLVFENIESLLPFGFDM